MNTTKKPTSRIRFRKFWETGIFLALFIVPNMMEAGTCTWNGGFGNWSSAANWTPAGVPSATDHVIINAGTIIMDIEATIGSLTMGGGTIDGSMNLAVTGNFDWSDGTLNGAGTLSVGGSLNISGIATKTISGRTLTANNAGSWSNGNINIGNSTIFRIAPGAVFYFDHSSEQTIGSGAMGTIDVQGTVTKTQGSITNYIGAFNVNGGSLAVSAGTLNGSFSSSGTHTGSVTVSSGAVFQFQDGTHDFQSGATVVGTGTLKVDGGTVNFNAGSSTVTNLELFNGTLNDHAGLTVANINQSRGTLAGTANTTVTNIFTWSRGTQTGTGQTVVSGTLNIDGSISKTLERTLRLTGTGNWTNGNISINATGILRVASGATFTINHSGNRNLGSASSGLIDIQGTVTKSNASITYVRSTLNTTASGTLNVNSSQLIATTSSSGSHNGTNTIASGATFEFWDGVHNFNSGSSVTGAGKIIVNNTGYVNFNSNSTLTTNAEVISGQLRDDVGFSPASFTQSGGTFTGTGNGTCTGNLSWSGGTISGSNLFTVAGTSTFSGTTRTLDAKTLKMNGNGNWQTGNFTFANNGLLHVGSSSTFGLNHTSNQSATGTGSLKIDGILSKTQSAPTTDFSISNTNDGTVQGIGPVSFSAMTNRAVFAPGLSPGKLTVNSFDNTNGILKIEIRNIGTPGTDYDQLEVTNTATLGGTLEVTLLDGFVPAVGNTFTFLTATTVSGTFNTETLPTLPSDRRWQTNYSDGKTELTVVALLPVELTRFSAVVMQEMVELNWETATETDNRGFEVQRSLNGTHWRTVGFMDGHGTTFTLNRYKMMDQPGLSGTVYYRLRQVDWNGNFELSPVVSVVIGSGIADEFVRVYPNPVQGEAINLTFKDGLEVPAFYEILDLSGKRCASGAVEPKYGHLEVEIPFNAPVSGVYSLVIFSGSKKQSIKLLVQ